MRVSSTRCKPSRWYVACVRRSKLDLGAVLAPDRWPFFHLPGPLDGETVPDGPLILREEHILARDSAEIKCAWTDAAADRPELVFIT